LTPELLFEVDLGLNWKNASVCLLVKEILGPLHNTSVLEEGEGPKDFFLIAGELLWGQMQSDLLQLSSQGCESGIDSMFQSVLSFGQLLEIVL